MPHALLIFVHLLTAWATEPTDSVRVSLLATGFLEPTLPLPEEVRRSIVDREHEQAADGLDAIDIGDLYGNQTGDHAFLLAWSLIRAERISEAVPLLPAIRTAQHVPEDYLQLTIGELLVEDGQFVEATRVLNEIESTSPNYARAMLVAANAYHETGATSRSIEAWEAIIARPHPAAGSEIALLALAEKRGIRTPAAYPYLRTLWTYYPTSEQANESRSALTHLESRGGDFRPTLAEIALRGDALMSAGHYRTAIRHLEPHLSEFEPSTTTGCIGIYAYGRSNYKINQVTRASQILERSGEGCGGVDDDRGAKSLYIAGKSLERLRRWSDAAEMYQLIPELYPDHSMADDGFALAGIAWQEVGQPERARSLWEEQVERYPEGDLAPEGFWRLAWTAYLAGNTEEAIEWAEAMIWQVPIDISPMHWMGAHYWSARWRIYPDVDDPTVENTDRESVEIGISLLADLCNRYPSRFYSLLAAARLYELAPELVASIERPAPSGHPTVWTVRDDFVENPAVERGVQLARLGLLSEAMAEFGTLPRSSLMASEIALIADIETELNWIHAHDRLHTYLLSHPAMTLGPDRDRILRASYPDTYWSLIEEVAGEYRYDPRIFHSLVREESSFNESIVSWAGARGLSQLMPPTARQVAGWLGIRVTDESMFDPRTNLSIGSRYLEYLHGLFDDNHFLSIAAYNAGEGNVGNWLERTGNIPTDEFIESIPIRETRRYVKRVLGTYQMYRLIYGEESLYPDWQFLNHRSISDG